LKGTIVPKLDHLRLAELTSSTGALVLGVGLGAQTGDRLRTLILPLVLVGAAALGWGVYDRRQIGRKEGELDVWWAAYAGCWGLLGLLGLAVLGRLLGLF
jgi:hypothetical protein